MAATVDVPICYTQLEFNPKAETEEVNTNCTVGGRDVPNYVNPEWSIEYKPTTVDVAAVAAVLAPGAIISFEIIHNVTDDSGAAVLAANQIIEVVRYSTVKSIPRSFEGKAIGRRRAEGGKGDYLGQQVGRSGLPAPFNAV